MAPASRRVRDATWACPCMARAVGETANDRLSSRAINFGIVTEAASFDADQCHKRTNGRGYSVIKRDLPYTAGARSVVSAGEQRSRISDGVGDGLGDRPHTLL